MASKSNKNAVPSFKTAKFMISTLRPVLDEWNRVINEAWTIEKSTVSGVTITESNHGKGIHGILAGRIAGICNAFDWCWAIYASEDEEGGIVVRIH